MRRGKEKQQSNQGKKYKEKAKAQTARIWPRKEFRETQGDNKKANKI